MRVSIALFCQLGLLLQAAMACAADVTVIRTFPANKGPGWKATIDVAGAVGPHHVVDFDVAAFVVHDKANGETLKRLSTREFWRQVEPAGTLTPEKDANDARIIYDALSERWFACAAGTTEPDCFLAVSTSSDPTEKWQGAKLPLPRINPYMKLGVDRNGLYVCSCNGNADMNKGTNCYVIPKRDAIADSGPVLTRAQTFQEMQFSTMPAIDPDPNKPADAPAILLANEFCEGTCSELYLYQVTWSDGKASISDGQTIPLSRPYLTPNNKTPQMEAFQPEPGPKLRAGGGGRRLDSAFVRDGCVFGCNGAKRTANSRPGVLWYQIRISDGKLVQEGFVDSPDRDYIYPSIAVDGRGNIGIGCTGTSQTEFPSVYVMMHGASDPSGTMRSPVRAVPGTTVYMYEGQRAVNWSHYSATCIDPSNPDLLWTLQAYANSDVDRQWCTAWAAFQLPNEEQSNRSGSSPRTSSAPDSEPTTPAVTSSLKTVGDDRYMVNYYDDGATKAYAVVIPEGLKTVRGLLINASYLGQDTRKEWTQCEYYRQFMHLHDFAFVGAADTVGGHPKNAPPLTENTARGRHYRVFQAFENSMNRVATAARHPELANAPYVSLGFSHGGGTSFNMMCFAPERTIAAVSYASPYNFKRRATLPVSNALLHVPSISITGEEEQFNAPLPPDVDPSEGPARIDEVFVPYRPKGGQYAWLEREGIGHTYDENRQDVMGMPLLDAAVRARYPKDGDITKGPIKLINLDPANGWIADHTTWNSGLTKIYPAGEFKGDLGQSSWLQNEDLAFIYRAYSTYDKPLTITSPGNCWPTMPALEPGASVPITVDASGFPDWKTMAFYDGATKLGEVTAGSVPRFIATDLTPGYHVFSILATDGDGNVRTADPKLIIVRAPAK